MKASDLRERTTADLASLRDQLRRELFSSRMKNFAGRLSDVSLIRKARRDIARVEGILRGRILGGDLQNAGAQAAEAAGSKES